MGEVVDFFSGGKGPDTASLDALRNQKIGNTGNLNLDFGAQIAARQAQPGVEFAGAPQAEARAQQMAFAQQLMQQAQGGGPSITGMQAEQAGQQLLANQLAAAQSARGTSAGLLQRQALQNLAAGQGQIAQQAMLGRLQEQQQAQGMLGQALAGLRAQDIGVAQSQAQTQLQSQAARDAYAQALMQQAQQRDIGQAQLTQAGMQDAWRAEEQAKQRRAGGIGSAIKIGQSIAGGIAQAGAKASTGGAG
jgi:hypothetical protein